MKKRNEYIYMDCKIRMSNKGMSDIMYAAIITKSGLPETWHLGGKEYSRKQSSHFMADIKVHIHPDNIAEFESLANVKLSNPITNPLQSK